MGFFDALKDYLKLPRSSKYFRERISTLAFCLGLIHRSVRTFALGKNEWHGLVNHTSLVRGLAANHFQYSVFGSLYSDTTPVLTQLDHIGTGLHFEKFQEGRSATLPLFRGIYLCSPISPHAIEEQTSALRE